MNNIVKITNQRPNTQNATSVAISQMTREQKTNYMILLVTDGAHRTRKEAAMFPATYLSVSALPLLVSQIGYFTRLLG